MDVASLVSDISRFWADVSVRAHETRTPRGNWPLRVIWLEIVPGMGRQAVLRQSLTAETAMT